MEFFCPLCGIQRAITHHYKLTPRHYGQMAALTLFFIFLLWPWWGLKSLGLFFLFWAIFEGVLRPLWRRELPCPHCGFDAHWYKTDVKIARQKVQEFWDGQKKAPSQSKKES